MKKIIVKTHKKMQEQINEFRNKGYIVTTYIKGYAEMENNNDVVVIDVIRGQK